MSINERINAILKSDSDYTQKDLAKYIGVASSTVNNWLKLGRSIPSEYIIPISEFLNVDIRYLLSGKAAGSEVSASDIEWLNLIHSLPMEAQYEFRGELKGYLKRMNKELNDTQEPRKTGTTNQAK